MEHKFTVAPEGYIRVDPLPSSAELSAYYSSDYYQNPHGTYASEYTLDEIRHKSVRNQFLFRVITDQVSHSKNFTFLDIGCGEGFLLATFARNGWNVLGLDFSSYGVAKFNPNMIDNLFVGDIYDSIENLIENNKTFDCINLGNVLEHVISPILLLERIRNLMSQHSALLITVPNDFSKLQEFLQDSNLIEKPYWIAVPDHLNYFNHNSLIETVRRSQLIPIEVLGDFPIEWFLTNDRSNYSKDPSAGKAAHFARITLDTLITSGEDFEAIKNFWSAMAGVGQGRTVSILCRKLDQ
jgi:SAM-dependent methyltransferase